MGKYTKEYCQTVVFSCSTLFELRTKDLPCYNAIKRNGWEGVLAELKPSIGLKGSGVKKSKKYCQEIFLKYKTRIDMENSVDKNTLRYAKKYGWIIELSPHWKRKGKPITHESCKKFFIDRVVFEEVMNASEYNWAIKNGFLEEFSSHLVRKKIKDGTWTKESLIELFSQYEKINDVINNHNGAYQTAIKKGWIDECTKHMTGYGNSSAKEDQLLDIIRKYYSSANSKWFGPCKKRPNS